jgi:hypothetical protein
MNFDPRREAFVAEGPTADPRAALVCETAARLYGAGWRFSISAEFAVGPDEIDDWIEGRAEAPDFLIAGLLRQVRVRVGAYGAVERALAEDTAIAPEGDYSFPDALSRNARMVIRECDPESLLYDEATGEYYFPDASTADQVAAPRASTADEETARPPLYLIQGGQAGRTPAEFDSIAYREPRVDARDRI